MSPGRERGRHAPHHPRQPVRRAEEGPAHRPGAGERVNLSEFKAVLAHEFGHFSQSGLRQQLHVRRQPDHHRPGRGRGLVRPGDQLVQAAGERARRRSGTSIGGCCGSGGRSSDGCSRRSPCSGWPCRASRSSTPTWSRSAPPAATRSSTACCGPRFGHAVLDAGPQRPVAAADHKLYIRTTCTCTRTGPRRSSGGRRRTRTRPAAGTSTTRRPARTSGCSTRTRRSWRTTTIPADVADPPAELGPRGERQGDSSCPRSWTTGPRGCCSPTPPS